MAVSGSPKSFVDPLALEEEEDPIGIAALGKEPPATSLLGLQGGIYARMYDISVLLFSLCRKLLRVRRLAIPTARSLAFVPLSVVRVNPFRYPLMVASFLERLRSEAQEERFSLSTHQPHLLLSPSAKSFVEIYFLFYSPARESLVCSAIPGFE